MSDDWTDAHASAPLRCAVSGAPLRVEGCVAYLYFRRFYEAAAGYGRFCVLHPALFCCRDPCYDPASGSISLDHAAEACKKLAVAVAHAQREGTFLLVEPDLRDHINVSNLALAFQSTPATPRPHPFPPFISPLSYRQLAGVLYPSSISAEDQHTAGIARSNLSMVSLATTDGLTPWMHEGYAFLSACLF